MNPQDISNTEAEYEKVHGAQRSVLTSRQDMRGWQLDLDTQQGEINMVLGGIEDLERFYDGKVKEFQHLRDGAADMKRKLTRDYDDCKRASIRISQEMKRNQLSQ